MKTFIGAVVSDKMQKSAVVKVNVLWQHPVYKKRIKRSKRFVVHDEIGVKIGQMVRIGENKPISKRKRWQILEVVRK